MNRKKLLALLRKHYAYDGADDLAAVLAFIQSEGIPVTLNGKAATSEDIAAVWAKTAPSIDLTDDEAQDDDADDDNDRDRRKRKVLGLDDDGDDADDDLDDEGDDDDANEPRRSKAADGRRRSKRAALRQLSRVNAALHADDRWGMSPKSLRNITLKKSYNARPKSRRGFNDRNLTKAFHDADQAEAFGAMMRLGLYRDVDYPGKSYDREIVRKSGYTTNNTTGGVLVPDDIEQALIDLKEERGAARALLPVLPMMNDTKKVRRSTGGLTVYAPGEGGTITQSDPTFDFVQLIAQKMATLTAIPNELIHDSAINFGDHIAREIAYAFADKEDECLFNGDGTSRYFGFTGIAAKFRQVLEDAGGTWGADNSKLAGLVVGSGNAYSELKLADFETVIGRAPSYVYKMSPRWAMHSAFYWSVVVPLIRAAGGTSMVEVSNGVRVPALHGFPVEFVNVMPAVEANAQVCALFGAFGEGAKMGEVTGSMSIARSSERYFDQDMDAIRGLQRVSVLVHDVGNYAATAAERKPGPIVGLVTAHS